MRHTHKKHKMKSATWKMHNVEVVQHKKVQHKRIAKQVMKKHKKVRHGNGAGRKLRIR